MQIQLHCIKLSFGKKFKKKIEYKRPDGLRDKPKKPWEKANEIKKKLFKVESVCSYWNLSWTYDCQLWYREGSAQRGACTVRISANPRFLNEGKCKVEISSAKELLDFINRIWQRSSTSWGSTSKKAPSIQKIVADRMKLAFLCFCVLHVASVCAELLARNDVQTGRDTLTGGRAQLPQEGGECVLLYGPDRFIELASHRYIRWLMCWKKVSLI